MDQFPFNSESIKWWTWGNWLKRSLVSAVQPSYQMKSGMCYCVRVPRCDFSAFSTDPAKPAICCSFLPLRQTFTPDAPECYPPLYVVDITQMHLLSTCTIYWAVRDEWACKATKRACQVEDGEGSSVALHLFHITAEKRISVRADRLWKWVQVVHRKWHWRQILLFNRKPVRSFSFCKTPYVGLRDTGLDTSWQPPGNLCLIVKYVCSSTSCEWLLEVASSCCESNW